jgi:hypothetical protein
MMDPLLSFIQTYFFAEIRVTDMLLIERSDLLMYNRQREYAYAIIDYYSLNNYKESILYYAC